MCLGAQRKSNQVSSLDSRSFTRVSLKLTCQTQESFDLNLRFSPLFNLMNVDLCFWFG